MTRDELKRQAASEAAAMVSDGMIVGLGTGSTAAFFIEALIGRVRGGLRIAGIPTSERSAEQARQGGISLTSFAEHDHIDLAVDGADEIEQGTLNLLKGLGGAALREKIVASAAKQFVIVADEEKVVGKLGSRAPVPVEVTRFGWELTLHRVRGLGATTTLRQAAGEPYITDGGNFILDATFGPIAEPAALDTKLHAIPGVVGNGLFIRMATLALVAGSGGVKRLQPGAH
jgi:ribose 5-phosphate isomerase A